MYRFSDIIKKGTVYEERNGIYYILEEPFQTDCRTFLNNYYKNNSNRSIINNYPALPYITGYKENPEWNFRAQSLQIIKNYIGRHNPKTILEIGPWNGWMTHHIANTCDTYVTADFFDDDRDGLGTYKHYPDPQWIPVHCDVEKLDFFSIHFDLIIYNHCLQFFENWEDAFVQAKTLLEPMGHIYVLGMNVYNNPETKQTQVAEYKANYFQRTGTNLLFRNTKAYFDKRDTETMENLNCRITNYPQYLKNNILRLFIHSRPQICYAVYRNSD